MTSFVKDINKIVEDLRGQLSVIESNKLPSLVIKSLLLADKVKGLNDEDKKIIVMECITALFNDDEKVMNEYMPLVEDLLNNLLEDDDTKNRTKRDKGCITCDNRCCEVITCRIMALWGKKPSDVS